MPRRARAGRRRGGVRIIPDTMPADERERLRAQGLTLVELPASDPDHQPAKRNGEDDE